MFRLLYRLILVCWLLVILTMGGVLAVGAVLQDHTTVLFHTLQHDSAYETLLDTQTGIITLLQPYVQNGVSSPDGSQIIVVETEEAGIELYVTDDSTQAARFVGQYPIHTSENFIEWSADGAVLNIVDELGSRSLIYQVNVADGSYTELGTYNIGAVSVFFAPDNNSVILQGSLNNRQNGMLVNLTTGESLPFGLVTRSVWSPDSQHVAYLRPPITLRDQAELHILNVADMTDHVYSSDNFRNWRILAGARLQWSPDSETLVITLLRQDEMGLYFVRPRDHELTLIQAGAWSIMDWSPDDNYLLIQRPNGDEQTVTIALLNLTTGERRDLFVDTRNAAQAYVAWSADMQVVALDYLPVGFRGDRILAAFDVATGERLYQRVLPLFDYYPVFTSRPTSTEFLAWWTGE